MKFIRSEIRSRTIQSKVRVGTNTRVMYLVYVRRERKKASSVERDRLNRFVLTYLFYQKQKILKVFITCYNITRARLGGSPPTPPRERERRML